MKRIGHLARTTALAAVLVVAAGLAGCFGIGDDADTDSSGNGIGNGNGNGDMHAPPPGNETGAPPNGTAPSNNTTAPAPGNETMSPPDDNETAEQRLEWSYDNRTGTVSGTALLFIGSSSEEESFLVENATVQMFLNFTVDGSGVDVEITPPGCEDDSCRVNVDASSGHATYESQDPLEGQWAVTFSSTTSIGPYSTDYELAIALAAWADAPAEEETGEENGSGDPE